MKKNQKNFRFDFLHGFLRILSIKIVKIDTKIRITPTKAAFASGDGVDEVPSLLKTSSLNGMNRKSIAAVAADRRLWTAFEMK